MPRDITVTTKVQPDIAAQLVQRAQAEDRSKASILRQALAKFLREQ